MNVRYFSFTRSFLLFSLSTPEAKARRFYLKKKPKKIKDIFVFYFFVFIFDSSEKQPTN